MTLKMTTATVLQILATVLQILNIALPIANEKGKIYIAAGIGGVQVLINMVSHLSNPNGTTAKIAWVTPENGPSTK